MKSMKIEEVRRGMDNIDISIEDIVEEETSEIMINNNELETNIDIEISPALPPETEEEKLLKKEEAKRKDAEEFKEFKLWLSGVLQNTYRNILSFVMVALACLVILLGSCQIYDEMIKLHPKSITVVLEAKESKNIAFTDQLREAIDNGDVDMSDVEFSTLEGRMTIIGHESLKLYCKDSKWVEDYNEETKSTGYWLWTIDLAA